MEMKSKEGKADSLRFCWIDAARVLAILAVSMNHALIKSFVTISGTSREFYAHSFMFSALKACLYCFSRLGVPLFLMITGALILDRDFETEGSIKRFYTKNWKGLFITTEIWLVLIYIYLSMFSDSTLRQEGIWAACKELMGTLLFVNQKTLGSMWYMPMILCLYLMLPIFSTAIHRIGVMPFAVPAAIVFVSSMVIPNINTFFSLLNIKRTLQLSLNQADVFSIYFLYVLAGYIVFKGAFSKCSSKGVAAVMLFFFVATVGFQFLAYSSEADYYVRYADSGILISSAALFELIKRGDHLFAKAAGVLKKLAEMTFGVYFVHSVIMDGLNRIAKAYLPYRHFGKLIFLEVVSMAVSYMLVYLLSKEPHLKKHLFYMR